MKKNITFLGIYIMSILAFFSCDNQKEKKWIDEYCENELRLIEPEKKPIFDIKLNSQPDSIFNILEKELKGNFCYTTKTFGIKIENFPIKVSVFKECNNGSLRFPSKTTIIINNKSQILINNESIIELNELSKNISEILSHSTNKKYDWTNRIDIYWAKEMNLKEINFIIKSIIKGYILETRKYSKKVFKKEIFELNGQEIIEIKKQFPFNLELGTLTERFQYIIEDE